MLDKDKIIIKLKKALIPPRILLSKFSFIDDASRYSRACLDPTYLPFYYYLGSFFPQESLLEIGFGLGVNAACYLIGNPNNKHYLSLQEETKEFYSPRLGINNIKKVWNHPFDIHVGKLHDESFLEKMRQRQWDLVFINEKMEYDTHLLYLHTVWEETKEDGIICVEHTDKSYKDFCIMKQRETFIFPTRYNLGIIQK